MTTTQQLPPKATIGSFVHTEITSNNVDADTAILGDVFGWTNNSMPGDVPYAMLEGPNGAVGGITGLKDDAGIPGTLSFIAVEDLDATTAKLKAGGASIVLERQEVPDMGAFIHVRLPGGAAIGVWQDLV